MLTETEGRLVDSAASSGYECYCCIGKANNATATVYLAKHETEPLVAVRLCPLESAKDEGIAALYNEALYLRKLKHPNVVKLLECSLMSETLIMAFPLLDMGSVTDVIHAGFLFGMPEMTAAFIIAETLKAMDYLHSIDIVHRSIRSSHILLGSKGQGQVVLAGFRHAVSMIRGGRRLSKNFEFTDSFRPSLLWMAPEVLRQNIAGYSFPSDIYSLGIAICEMANGFPPFGDMELMQMLFEKLRGTVPRLLDRDTCAAVENDSSHSRRRLSQMFHDFASLCLQTDPDSRPTARELMGHVFLKQLKKNKQTLRHLLLPVVPISEKSPRKQLHSKPEPELEVSEWDFS